MFYGVAATLNDVYINPFHALTSIYKKDLPAREGHFVLLLIHHTILIYVKKLYRLSLHYNGRNRMYNKKPPENSSGSLINYLIFSFRIFFICSISPNSSRRAYSPSRSTSTYEGMALMPNCRLMVFACSAVRRKWTPFIF